MSEKLIICQHCQRAIKDQDDLVTAWVLFSVAPYHSACYSRALKGFESMIVGNNPINGCMGTSVAVFAISVALVTLFAFPPGRWLGLILLIPGALRAYSWLAFERHLD